MNLLNPYRGGAFSKTTQEYSIELKRITYLKFKLDIQKCTWIRGEYNDFHKIDSISSSVLDLDGQHKERITIDENTTSTDREYALKIYPVSEQGREIYPIS